jgi:molybdopterin converting factor small subunit
MTIRIVLPASLADLAGGSREIDVACGPQATLGEVLAILGDRFPALGRRVLDETGALRRFVNVYVGTEECRRLQELTTPVAEGVTVHIIGSIAGG